MADQRYTDDQVREQIAAVVTLLGEGMSHAQIAEQLGISKSTVHARRHSAGELDRRQDQAAAASLRVQATAEMHGWLARIDDDYAADKVDVVSAAREATRIWAFLAGLWGANLPIQVRVQREVALASMSGDGADKVLTMLEARERAQIEMGRAARATWHRASTESGS